MRFKFIKTAKYITVIMLIIASLCVSLFITGCKKPQEEENTNVSTERIDEDIYVNDVLHEQGDVYLSTFEPTDKDNVTVRLRVRRGNAKTVTLQYTVTLSETDSKKIVWKDLNMEYDYSDVNKYYDYYRCVVPAQKTAFRYHFIIENNKQTVFYAGRQILKAKKDTKGNWINPFGGMSSDFLLQVNFKTPDWSKGATWYSAMPDSFYNGDVLADKYGGVITQKGWNTVKGGGLGYFGGDMQGLQEKIDYMKDLGVTALFINPIWLANHNAGYGFFDGLLLDSTFGNEEKLKELTSALHENDMYLMMDRVFNYFVSSSAYVNGSSLWPTGNNSGDPNAPYYDIFLRDDKGQIIYNQFGAVVDFAKEDAKKLIYTDSNSLMQYYLNNCGVDGWRLDSAILYKTSDGTTGTQIIQDMRKYTKAAAPDSLLCLENANEAGMYTDYAADTYWNQRFLKSVEGFIGTDLSAATLELLSNNVYEAVLGLPRAVAHSSYNMLTNHDGDRILYTLKDDMARAQALNLILMTYMGSPTIFFGEEIGLNSANRFYESMSWDESVYNYDMYDLMRALGAFRTEYKDLVKYGILENKGVDTANMLMMYQRKYGDSASLTVANPDGKVKRGVQIDVHSMEVAEGGYLYDYLSGNSYKVTGGKVTIDIMPYGALLTNKKSNKWAGNKRVETVGQATGTVINTDVNTYKVNGTSAFSGSKDSFVAMTSPVFNNYSLTFSGSGNYAVQMRASLKADSAFYAVAVNGSTAKVLVREKDGETAKELTSFTVSAGDEFKLVRTNNNIFQVYKKQSGDYIGISKTTNYCAMEYQAIAAVSPNGGNGELTAETSAEQEQVATTFDTKSDSMMFTLGDTSSVVISDGLLKLQADKNGVFRLTKAHVRDFTFKTTLYGQPKNEGDFFGTVVYQSQKNYLAAGRIKHNGKVKIALIQAVGNGVIIHSEVDDVDGALTVQLERAGSYWTARYKQEGEKDFNIIGSPITVNYSELSVGLMNKGGSVAEFDYFCFGDAITDGRSYSTPASYGELSQINPSLGYNLTGYTLTGGVWRMKDGSFVQSDASSDSVFRTNQGKFKDFRADYTVTLNKVSSDSNVALHFGISGNSEYYLKLNADGSIVLENGGKALAQAKVEGFALNKHIRILAVMYSNKMLAVFTGTQNDLAFTVTLDGYTEGNLRIEGHKAAYTLDTFQFQIEDSVNPNRSVTDAVITVNLKFLKQTNLLQAPVFGIVIGGSVDAGKTDALFVGLNKNRKVYIEVDGKTVKEVQLGNEFKDVSTYLTIVVKGSKVSVFADAYTQGSEYGKSDYSTEPVLEYDDGIARGGAVSVYSQYGQCEYNHFAVYGLRSGEDYTQLDIFKKRMID